MRETMKVALLGKGKTGSKVIEILGPNGPTIFDTTHPPTVENLKGHDVIISFLPGDPFREYLPVLVESQIPVVTGTTGMEWPPGFAEKLTSDGVSWIWGHNFSLGMNLVHQMIKILNKAPKLFGKFKFDLHETHHIMKVDAPSGTALKWQDWLGHPIEDIKSSRVGDVVGVHEMTVTTPSEKITLKHEALDRKIFAEGAIWAAEKLLSGNLTPGLHKFEELALKELV